MNQPQPTPPDDPRPQTPEKRHLPKLGWILPMMALVLPFLGFYCTNFVKGPPKPTSSEDFVPDPIRGALLFTVHCARCHGETGKGDGPMAKGQPKPPRDLTIGGWTLATNPVRFKEILISGIDGGLMPSFKLLSNRDQDNLVDFTWKMGMDTKKPKPESKK